MKGPLNSHLEHKLHFRVTVTCELTLLLFVRINHTKAQKPASPQTCVIPSDCVCQSWWVANRENSADADPVWQAGGWEKKKKEAVSKSTGSPRLSCGSYSNWVFQDDSKNTAAGTENTTIAAHRKIIWDKFNVCVLVLLGNKGQFFQSFHNNASNMTLFHSWEH